jgi:hypothetical protein
MAHGVRVIALGRTDPIAMEMPDRFRLDVVYFMTPCDRPGAPQLGPNEYWIEPANIEKWLDDGGFSVVSPLDAESVAEIELTEDQERWLEWMKKHAIDRIRVERIAP